MQRAKQIKVLFIFLLIALGAVIACSKKPPHPKDEWFLSWRIGAAISMEYPMMVREAYGINEHNGWTSMMLPYGQLATPSRLNMKNFQQYLAHDYDGYGMPLTGAVNYVPGQVGLGAKELPDAIYIAWQSWSSHIKYSHQVPITRQIKAAMFKVYPNPVYRLRDKNCYQSDFIFGLFPDGRAKLWLKGCDFYTYIGEFKPNKTTYPKNWTGDTRDIPWDKVNKIWVHPNYQMQTLDEAMPLSEVDKILAPYDVD